MIKNKTYQQVLLIILDGWGYSQETKYNAIYQAHPQYFNHLWKTYPHALFQASGQAVGLPEGIIGTSEIGHMTVGAGRIIDTDMVRVFKAIKNNTLKDNDVIQQIFAHVKKYNSTLHFMGLVSPGGVHSHQEHLFALLTCAKDAGIKKIVIDVFTDGRDTPPRSAYQYVTELEDVLQKLGIGRIAVISGRYYAMDRDHNWDRIQKTADAIFEGKGQQYQNKCADQIIKEQYATNTGDEFITPCVLLDEKGQPTVIEKNDGIFFFNFRPDRARELSEVISKKRKEMNLCFVTLTLYDKAIDSLVAFPPEKINETLANEVSDAGLTQIHIAETEKYAHVTYFLNGGNEKEHKGEKFVLIKSRKDVPTFDFAPEMKTKEIVDRTIEAIHQGINFIAINLCNADMVGHTGKWDATIKAVQFLDEQLKRVIEALLANNGVAFITADHGNAELMYDEKNHQPHTAHTLNPVPGILTISDIILKPGGLSDVAPTILQLFGIKKPKEMTGESLIEEK